MVTYRPLSSDEMPAAVKLWVEVFGVEAPFFQTLLDGGDVDDFSVGAFEDGRQVSSVHVFMRWFRDRNGIPQKVGGIGSVSTLPDARSQGHSSRLLKMAIEEMETRSCIWSYLGTGVNDHYARHGWRTLSTPSFCGHIREDLSSRPLEHKNVDDNLLTQMAGVHQAYTAGRPMANVRSKALWTHSVQYRTTRPAHAVHTTVTGDATTSYLLCGRSEKHLDIIEGACLPGHEQDLSELISASMANASESGIRSVTYHLPELSVAFPAFADACTRVWCAEDRAWMARPIANRISWPDLAAIHADPRGRRSELDHF